MIRLSMQPNVNAVRFFHVSLLGKSYVFSYLSSLGSARYTMIRQFSTKGDVFCFGVVLLELLTGRKAFDRTLPRGQQKLVTWVRMYIQGYRYNFFRECNSKTLITSTCRLHQNLANPKCIYASIRGLEEITHSRLSLRYILETEFVFSMLYRT
jgi:hypothetical protein